MNKIETKLLLFLASPELTDSDFKQLADLLYNREFKEILSAADHLRQVSRDCLKKITRSRVPDDFVEVIQNLLIKEGGMNANKAIRLLLSELRDEPIPSLKWTIRSGLEYAAKHASEAEIITAARRIIEKHLPSDKIHAWSLKKPTI